MRIDSKNIDIDHGLASATFDKLAPDTKIIVQIGLNYASTKRSHPWQAALTIAHEVTVHAMPFLSVIGLIRAGANRSAIVKHWTAPKNNGLNAVDNQHHRLGQGLTEFMNLIADMRPLLRSTRDQDELQAAAAQHVIEYGHLYPAQHKYHARE